MSHLKRLQITRLRNIQQTSLHLSPGVNIFYGENGSGKTSLLEAVSLLGLGRSFRSHKTRSLIAHEHTQLTVFAELETTDFQHIAVGVQKDQSGNTLIRVNGDNVPSAAVLARQLPLQILNADSFQLIEGSPLQRRRFLDWMVFHVKPEFIDPWQRLQRVIKQRNSLLRHDKITRLELAPWDKELIALTLEIDSLRRLVFEEFMLVFAGLAETLSEPLANIELAYLPGWDNTLVFADVLAQDFDRDRRDGYTHHGPQRADIRITVAGKPAMDVLSRGQEKSLICMLHIAQAQLYQQKTGRACVFLIDDLLAELDVKHAQQLATWLLLLKGQVLVTGIDKSNLQQIWSEEGFVLTLFHVEQGAILSEDK
jgi:DNA replication and repair protein RecF